MTSDTTDLEIQLLSLHYRAAFSGNQILLPELCEARGWQPREIERAAHRLESEGLVDALSPGRLLEITPAGMIEAESTALREDDLAIENARIRIRALRHLQNLYDSRGPRSHAHFRSIADELLVPEGTLYTNLDVLEYQGFVEDEGSVLRITTEGIDALRELASVNALRSELERVQRLEPHARGHAFGPYLRQLLSVHGWDAEVSVRTSNEEIDLVLRRSREIYFLEAKWLAAPVEAAEIRSFTGKLSTRIDVRGIFVSMSGYSRGAVEACTEVLSSSVLLAFGPEDVQALTALSTTFDAMLDEKYEALVVRKQLMWH